MTRHSPWCVLALSAVLLADTVRGEPVPVVLDTDMAGDCDDAGALAVLHALADSGEARILAVVTNRRCPANASAAAVDAINTYYGRGGIPIGTDKDGAKLRRARPSPFTPALRDEFPHDSPSDAKCPDALAVYRKVLAAAADHSVVVCSIGALSNLEDLLRSGPDDACALSGRELIRRKVKQTVIMGGGFPRTRVPETNIRLDPAAAATVTNEWPGPILWQGFEVGAAVVSGASLKKTPRANPVRRAFELRPYLGRRAIDKGKPSHDQVAVLLAVRGPQPQFWEVVRNGRVVFDSDGHCQWKSDWKRDHRYVRIKADPAALARVVEALMMRPPKK